MKKIVLLAASFLTVLTFNASAAGVGIVDMKTIFSDSSQVKVIKAKLSKQFEPQKTKLEKMGELLQSDIAKYQKDKDVMDKKDLSTLETNITNQENTFRAAQTKFQQEVFTAQNDSLNDFMSSVKTAVGSIAKQEKLDLVIPSNDVLYAKDGMDITQKVLQKMK